MYFSQYMDNLIKQFMEATGRKVMEINSRIFLQEFLDWLKSKQMIANSYVGFLIQFGTEINDETIEIGKGKYDSLFATKLYLTPYPEDFISTNTITFIGDFIAGSEPRFLADGNIYSLNGTGITRYITHNPYNINLIKSWDEIYKESKANITIGMFGNVKDCDYEKKISELQEFRERLVGTKYKYDVVTNNDEYYAVISSNRKIKVKK